MKKRLSLFLAAFVVAAFGIVAFSSFKEKSPEQKTNDFITLYNVGGVWTDEDPGGVTCNSDGAFCRIIITDAYAGADDPLDIAAALPSFYNVAASGEGQPATVLLNGRSYPVAVEEKTP